MSAHALLSASSAQKWLICTPSARLEETLPETTSEDAERGKLAHEIAELKLRKYFIEPMGPVKFKNRLKKLQENPLYQDEMLRHTETYLDYASKIVHGCSTPPYVAIEKRLDFSSYAPEGFGTGDCIILYGDTLHVIDFKYGQGVPVKAENNPQMQLYALGAYSAYSILYPIEKIKMAIVQPRVNKEPSEHEISLAELLAWGESIKPIAQKAFAGEGEYVPGEHCGRGFCRAKALCRARAETNISLEEYRQMKPPLISNEEVGAILKRAQDLSSWAKHLKDYALAQCLAGKDIPGWKAVHGRGERQYVNQEEAFKTLIANGISETMLYQRNPLTVPAVEDLLGKKQYTELLVNCGHVKMEPGKPTLALLSDTREAIKRISAQEDFKAIELPVEPVNHEESLLEKHKRLTANL